MSGPSLRVPSWALLVWRLGVIHKASAAMTTRIAAPVAPHLNFFARAMVNSTKKPFSQHGPASERRRADNITPGYADDRERAENGGQHLVVFVERRVSDIYHIARLHPELLRNKDRYRLEQVQPKNARPGRGIGLQIPHSEHINARFVCPLVHQSADIAQRFEQADVGLGHLDIARLRNGAEHGVD